MSREVEEKKSHTVTEIAQGGQRLEILLTELFNHPTDRFYAHMFYHIDRKADNKACPTMGVGLQNGRIKLVYNTEFLSTLSDESAKEILKHECLHLINDHLNRGDGAKEKDMLKHKMENIAQDCAINQYLNKKVIEEVGGVTLEKFREVLKHMPDDFTLTPKMPYEYYYDLLEQEKEDRQGEGDKGDGEGQGSFGQELGD
jgi:predicted metal-dependent peptidase